MAIRLILAEDNYLVREGLRQILSAVPSIEVEAECSDVDTLLEEIESRPPDVVLTDIRVPPSNTDEGIRVAGRLRSARSRSTSTRSSSRPASRTRRRRTRSART